jgi:hypothetical protein
MIIPDSFARKPMGFSKINPQSLPDFIVRPLEFEK